MSATSGNPNRPRPRLEVLPGGRTDLDAGGADWQQFTQRIGWQQLTEPALPDDYEDRLVARLFAPADHKLVSLDAERVRARGVPALSLATEAGQPVVGADRSGASRSALGWQLTAVAVVAMLVVGAAVLVWRGGEAPPEASTIPTPVPESLPSPVAPTPVDDEPESQPEPKPSFPDPGVRRAERSPVPPQTPRRAWRGQRRVAEVARPTARPQGQGSGRTRPPVADYRISPESEPAPRALPLFSRPAPLWLPGETAHRTTIRLAAQPAAGRAPTWHHLAVAHSRSGSQAMALVDVLELDRRLSEAL